MTLQDVIERAKALMVEHSVMEDHSHDEITIMRGVSSYLIKIKHPISGEIVLEAIPHELVEELLSDAIS